MAFTELERSAVEEGLDRFLEKRRPPPDIRSELDLQYRIFDQSVELMEVRPHWEDPDEIMETPVAKLTYVRSRALWKIYWMRQDLKWHGYEPVPQVGTLTKALEVVGEDRYCCFFG